MRVRAMKLAGWLGPRSASGAVIKPYAPTIWITAREHLERVIMSGPTKPVLIKKLYIVTAFVVLINIQPFDLFLFRHSEPYYNVNRLEKNEGEQRCVNPY